MQVKQILLLESWNTFKSRATWSQTFPKDHKTLVSFNKGSWSKGTTVDESCVKVVRYPQGRIAKVQLFWKTLISTGWVGKRLVELGPFFALRDFQWFSNCWDFEVASLTMMNLIQVFQGPLQIDFLEIAQMWHGCVFFFQIYEGLWQLSFGCPKDVAKKHWWSLLNGKGVVYPPNN